MTEGASHISGAQSQENPPFYPQTAQPTPIDYTNTPEYISALEKRIKNLEYDLRRMTDKLNQSITRSDGAISKIPKSAILSPRYLSRAFTVWGHYFVAQFIIGISIYCIVFLIGIALSNH